MEKQYVVHYHDYGVNLYSFPDNITMEEIIDWFVEQENFDEDTDTLDFFDGIYDVKI